MRLKNNRVALGIALATTALTCSVAEAGLLVRFPDFAMPVEVENFDWAPGGVLAQAGNTAVDNFLATQMDGMPRVTSFNVFSHTRLNAVEAPGGGTVALPGLNSSYEITMTLGFSEEVINAASFPGTVFTQLETLPGNAPLVDVSTGAAVAPSFVEIWFDDLTDGSGTEAVFRDGSGFNDGDRVLIGEIAGGLTSGTAQGNFTTTGPGVLLPLTNTGQYPGVQTIQGSGTNQPIVLDPATIVVDPTFFVNQIAEFVFPTIVQGSPFVGVNPSDCFTPRPGLTGLTCFPDTPAPPSLAPRFDAEGTEALIPSIGSVNGLVDAFGATSDDFVFQTDFSNTFEGAPLQVVPEPGSLALLGSGLAFMFARRRRPAH